LRGVPLVVTFVAAHCHHACPLVNAQFAMAQREIAAQRLRVVLLTITLDPAHDSPATMRRLARTFGADPRYWKVASGSVGDVRSVMQAFGVVAQPGRDGYAEAHTTFVYFIDAHGVLRKTILASYDLGTQLVEQLHQNWRALAS
jgi:cytochrome oxidase Cu insertion factor (SCO1/SenC/PrrC family)